ncbi:DUF6415 family natural product biosynthesis protein [Streptomyces sp. NPDC000878]
MNVPLPVDIETMRTSARRLFTPDAEVPSTEEMEELETLTLTLRGHLALIIPEVERVAAGRGDDDDMPRVCARTAVAESRRKLNIEPRPGPSSHLAYARRLSRSLIALCDHYEQLSSRASGARSVSASCGCPCHS